VLRGDIVDQLHDDDGLAHARSAEQANLAAAQIRLQEVDDLDAGLEHLEPRRLVFKRGSVAVNGVEFRGIHRTHFIYGLAENVHHAAQCFRPDRHLHGMAQADRLHSAHQPFGGLQGDRAHAALADVLLRLQNDIDRLRHVKAFADDANGGVHRGDLTFRELAVHGRSGHLDYSAYDMSVCAAFHLFCILLASGF
jgi:hypothetical protein